MQIEALKQVQPIMARGTYFRLHSNYRFQREPERFYLNFVESQHTPSKASIGSLEGSGSQASTLVAQLRW
jgi:hypothetical protein